MFFALKVALTALIVAGASELAKRYPLAGAVLISLPLSSILALTWLQVETRDDLAVATLATSIFWMVIPSLVFFVVLAFALRGKIPYWPALGLAIVTTVGSYYAFTRLLKQFGILI